MWPHYANCEILQIVNMIDPAVNNTRVGYSPSHFIVPLQALGDAIVCFDIANLRSFSAGEEIL